MSRTFERLLKMIDALIQQPTISNEELQVIVGLKSAQCNVRKQQLINEGVICMEYSLGQEASVWKTSHIMAIKLRENKTQYTQQIIDFLKHFPEVTTIDALYNQIDLYVRVESLDKTRYNVIRHEVSERTDVESVSTIEVQKILLRRSLPAQALDPSYMKKKKS